MVLIALALPILLRTSFARSRIEHLIERQAARVLNGQLEIRSISGGVLSGLQLYGVSLTQDGVKSIEADQMSVRYSALQLLRGESIVIDRLHITGLTVRGFRTPSGSLNLSSLLKPRSPGGGPGQRIDLKEIDIRGGSLTFESSWGPSWLVLPRRLTNIAAKLGLSAKGSDILLNVERFAADGASPDFQVRRFDGTIHFTTTGWAVDNGSLRSAASNISFSSRIGTSGGTRNYDVAVARSDVDFPELARVFPGLRSIDVPAKVTLRMAGPEDRLATSVQLESGAGSVAATLTLDSTVPGWSGTGAVDVTNVDISRWLPTDSTSDITGRAEFDLLLGLGRHFPRGSFRFAGPRARYLGYEATEVRARGRLVPGRAEIAQATGRAYKSAFSAGGSIDIDAPYNFRLSGSAASLDLRQLPRDVNVPRVPTLLHFDYDARGRFQRPFLAGSATFRQSVVLGATIEEGTVGSLDTSVSPTRYAAAGSISALDLRTVGDAFAIASLQTAQYAGSVAGPFDVAGEGTTLETLDLRLAARNATIAMFGGVLRNLQYDGRVLHDSLTGSGSAVLDGINPGIALQRPGYEGSMNGLVTIAAVHLPRVFSQGVRLADAQLTGEVALEPSRLAQVSVERAVLVGALEGGILTVRRASLIGKGFEARGDGTIAASEAESDFKITASTHDLQLLSSITPFPLSGAATVHAALQGPLDTMTVRGTFAATGLAVPGGTIAQSSGDFSGTIPASRPKDANLDVNLGAAFIALRGWTASAARAKVAYRGERVGAEVKADLADGRRIAAAGNLLVHADHRELHLESGRLDLAGAGWEIPSDAHGGTVSWDSQAVHFNKVAFASSAHPQSRLSVNGSVRLKEAVGSVGSLSVRIADVPVDSLSTVIPALKTYRGLLAGEATITGSLERPQVDAALTLNRGGFRQFTFDALTMAGRWTGEDIEGDVRLEQAPGRWLTMHGTIPSNVFSRSGPARPLDLTIRSSAIDLALLQGFTSAASNVTGSIQLDLKANGVSQDPHFSGSVEITDAGFLVSATGARYQKGNARVVLAPDTVTVERFRLEDDKGDPLELSGSASTHELRIGEFGAELSATRFEILQNELGDVDVNAVVTVSGTPAAPVISGDLAVDHATVAADVLLRYYERPYATTAHTDAMDPFAAAAGALSNWWDRTSLRLRLQATNNLTVKGTNLQFRAGAAAGLGDVDATFGGDFTLRKVPGGRLALLGALRTERGSYAFQGRRFTIERDGTIRFTGTDTAPVLSISASRLVAGVQIRAGLMGTTAEPQLELSSSPGLEQTDIISLLLFNVPANELATEQRDTLAIQAAALSSGFIVSPAVSALGRAVGLDFLQLEPVTDQGNASFRVSAGRNVWRDLFVTYSREIGIFDYNELAAEYSLSRYLRLKGNASDADRGRSRTGLYRRVERAGIDLLFFFSY